MKKIYIFFIILIIFILFLNFQGAGIELKNSSYIYRGNLLRNGVYNTKPILTIPKIKWVYNEDKNELFYRIGFCKNNIILISYNWEKKEGTYVKAIDSFSGKLSWKYYFKQYYYMSQLVRPIATYNDIIIISTRDLKIYALNALNGNVLWQIDEIEGSFSESVPTVYENIIFLGSRSESEFEEDYIHFCGYDLYNGKIVWEYPIYNGSNTAPIIDNGKLYINDGWCMLCIDIKTRKLIWKYNCKGWIAVDAVLSENILLVCDRGEGLKALDKNTGKVIWRNENYIFERGLNYEPPVVVKDKIYFKYFDNDNKEYLCCININNGKLIWKKNVKELGCRFVSMLVVDKYIYATSFPLNIVCFNTETNSILWRYDFPIPKNQKDYETGYLTIYDSKIYIATTDGKIYCME